MATAPPDGTPTPLAALAEGRLGRARLLAIAVCVLLNALDGYDVLSVSFASPGIAAEWGVDRLALGAVLSMELIGMGAGSLLLGAWCDRIGRRPTILLCLGLMAVGMALAATAWSVPSLSAFRLLTGVGIGGMLAATNAATAEYGTRRHHDLAVALMAGGYPLGAVVGGAIATHLLVGHDWRWVFGLGAVLSAGFVPVVLLLVPETPAFLWRRRPAGALAGLNRWLVPLGHGALAGLPDPVADGRRGSFGLLFGRALRRTTACITLAYVAQIMTFYFILKWTPKIVVDLGFAPATAGGVLVWANIGGLAGSIALSLLTRVAPVRALTIGGMVLSVVLVAAFGRVGADLSQLKFLAAVAGVCTNAGMVGLYAIVAARFPAEARGSGTGFVIGVGRAGAALSPMLAGWLFRAGEPLPTVALLMASGSAVAALSLWALGRPRTGWSTAEGAR